jgi:hypothetical protein
VRSASAISLAGSTNWNVLAQFWLYFIDERPIKIGGHLQKAFIEGRQTNVLIFGVCHIVAGEYEAPHIAENALANKCGKLIQL